MHRLTTPQRYGLLVPLLAGLVVLLGAMAVGAIVGFRPALGPLILVSPLAIAAAWIAYRAPGLTFAAYLAIPFYKAATDAFLPIDLTIIVAAVNVMQAILAFLPGINEQARGTEPNPARRWSLFLWFSLTVLIVLGCLYAPEPGIAFNRSINWIVLGALPLLAAFRVASDRQFLIQFLWSTFAVGAAVTLAGLWLLPSVGAWPADRLIVFGAHTIRVGQAALLVPLIAFAYIIPTSRPLVRLASLALVPFALLVSASSGSRGPLMMGAITLVIFAGRALLHRIGTRRRKPITIAPIRIAAIALVASLLIGTLQPAVLVALIPETAVERLGSIADIFTGLANQDLAQSAPDTSTLDRLVAYDTAIGMFNQNPLFGQGTASFASFTGGSGIADWPVDIAYPHNLILQFAAEYGLAGLALLAAMLFLSFRNLFAHSRDRAWLAVMVLLVFFLLSAIVSSGIIDNRTLWGLVLLGMAAGTMGDQRQQRSPQPAPGGNAVIPAR